MNKNGLNVSIILPSYNPDERLCRVISGLVDYGFSDIIVINDGSDEDRLCYFPTQDKFPECTVITHDENMGKGAALKTGFRYFLATRGNRLGVITVDGDNQHAPEDIYAVAKEFSRHSDEIVIGSRDYKLPGVPRSRRSSNSIASFLFRLVLGLRVSDTQSGLRALPKRCLPVFVKIKDNRYGFEVNMFQEIRAYGMKYREFSVNKVCIEKEKASHFNPIVVVYRICSIILRFSLSASVSVIVELILFSFFQTLFADVFEDAVIILSLALSRAVSSIINFNINKKVVFTSGEDIKQAIPKFYVYTISQMLVSAMLIYIISWMTYTEAVTLRTIIKVCVDTALFPITFRVQREWVFKTKKEY